MQVVRYARKDPITGMPGSDRLRVGDHDLGEYRDIVDAEYKRAKRQHPDNPAFHMRPMFFTGSPYGREIMQLVEETRG